MIEMHNYVFHMCFERVTGPLWSPAKKMRTVWLKNNFSRTLWLEGTFACTTSLKGAFSHTNVIWLQCNFSCTAWLGSTLSRTVWFQGTSHALLGRRPPLTRPPWLNIWSRKRSNQLKNHSMGCILASNTGAIFCPTRSVF